MSIYNFRVKFKGIFIDNLIQSCVLTKEKAEPQSILIISVVEIKNKTSILLNIFRHFS